MLSQPVVKNVTLVFACLAMLSVFFNQTAYNTITLLFLLFAVGLFIVYKPVFQAIVQPYRSFFILLTMYFVLYQMINLYHLQPEDFWYAFRRSRWILYAAFFIPVGIFLFRNGISAFYRQAGPCVYLLCALLAGLILYDSFTRLAFDEASTVLWWKTSNNHTAGPRVSWTYNPIPFSQLALFASLVFYAIFYCARHRGLRYSALALAIGMLAIVIFSQTRASWLALLIMSCILVFFLKKTRVFTIAAVFFTLILSAEVLTEQDLFKRFLSIQDTGGNAVRLELWQANLKLSTDHPWLGVGYAENLKPSIIDPYLHRFTENEAVLYQHPHNEYLDRLSGMGIPALLLFISILLWPLVLALRLLCRQSHTLTERQYHLATLAFGYLIFMLVVAFFDKVTLTSWSTTIFCWALIFYLHNQQHRSD